MKSIFCCLFILVSFHTAISQGNLIAFSLSNAEKRVKKDKEQARNLQDMGGISKVFGFVIDPVLRDIILIGKAYSGDKPITLSDLTVALRARFVLDQWPLVSIDRDDQTSINRLQKVRFEGVQAESEFAADMLAADIVLKNLALGKQSAELWGVKSYFDLCLEAAKNNKSNEINSLFWFVVEGDPARDQQTNALVIGNLKLGVKNQIVGINGTNVLTLSAPNDSMGNIFAQSLTRSFNELSLYFPEIQRLFALFSLMAVADGIKDTKSAPDINFWLKEFEIEKEPIQEFFPLMEREEPITGSSEALVMNMNGGVELKALVSRIKDGSVSALKDIVLLSRPDINSLYWEIPISDWQIPGDAAIAENPKIHPAFLNQLKNKLGTQITGHIYNPATSTPYLTRYAQVQSPIDNMPQFKYTNAAFQRQTGDIGGVLLSGTAQINTNASTDFNIIEGNFSLVSDEDGRRINPDQFRKFVTALWAVYYGKEFPGISIDPIGQDVDRHLVRYIGNVVNTDLGRVMREADYDMKKVAVGKKNIEIPGFQPLENLMRASGVNYLGASRRFWFVPEDMRFFQADNMLLFDSGRMTLKTEYVFQDKEVEAEPADMAFADFYTKNYEAIARKYPIYKELFEYAKLAALADYLKKKNVPLFWFLMANKDIVIPENSPGTVMELTKTSKIFKDYVIRGGVILGADKPQYVYDEHAVASLTKAIENQQKWGNYTTTTESSYNMNNQAPGKAKVKSYTVVPQHSFSSALDARGIRYQTDIAIRESDNAGIEFVRYFHPNQREQMGEFGRGWQLLLPYSISLVDNDSVIYGDYIVKKRLALTNVLSGEKEVLTFNDKKYNVPAYIPKDTLHSSIMCLVPGIDNLFLVDKLGNEFHFDDAWNMTDIILGQDFHLKIEYNYDLVEDFESESYRILPIGEDRVDIEDYNISVPARLELKNLIYDNSTAFVFDSNLIYYLPKDSLNSRYSKMFMLTDGSFRLVDKRENEFVFDASGGFEGMFPNVMKGVIQSVSREDFTIMFLYKLTEDNDLVIANSNLINKNTRNLVYSCQYNYDHGRLIRVEKYKLR